MRLRENFQVTKAHPFSVKIKKRTEIDMILLMATEQSENGVNFLLQAFYLSLGHFPEF